MHATGHVAMSEAPEVVPLIVNRVQHQFARTTIG